jgi:hypothetical protein
MAIVPDRISAVTKKFLKYSFEEIDFTYEQLTPEEKSLCTKDEFEELVKWLKETP